VGTKNIYNTFFNICIGLHSEVSYGVCLKWKNYLYTFYN